MGEVFTPRYLVKNMLDILGYFGENIKNKHIIDNSCGDGAFLDEIVYRFCEVYKNDKNLKQLLEKFIHGIEIDERNYNSCIKRLNKLTEKYGIYNVAWDIINSDTTFIYKKYISKMDFVVGNPPYVRRHNLSTLGESNNEFKFIDGGMIDLYIVFYEISFLMLKETGRMCLITPSSFTTSIYGRNLRKYIQKTNSLYKVIDLNHFQPFKGINVYTIIMAYDNNYNKDYFEYAYFDDKGSITNYNKIKIKDCLIDDKMYFGNNNELSLLNKILTCPIDKDIQVKNGFATLADKIFISDNFISNELVIDILKASSGDWKKAIFPYKNGVPIKEEILAKEYSWTYKYLSENKDKLLKRSLANSDEWYLFGRNQAVKDVNTDKIAINTVIKDINSLRIIDIPKGVGVYSGLYIISKKYSYEDIRKILISNDFINFIKILRKYKSGGYYTFSSKELLKFISFKLSESSNE